MQGIICMWHGLIVDIPNGWALCDGTNGTPDLRYKFVFGAPDGEDPGDIGGAVGHLHAVAAYSGYSNPFHLHAFDVYTQDPNWDSSGHTPVAGNKMEYQWHVHQVYGNTGYTSMSHRHYNDFNTAAEEHLPPFYEILFIMKL